MRTTILAVLTAITLQIPASAQYLVDTGPYWTVPGVNGSYMTYSMGVGPAYYGPPAFMPQGGGGGGCDFPSNPIEAHVYFATRPISMLSKALKKHKAKHNYVKQSSIKWHGVISELKSDGSWKVTR